jgi:cytochrome c oxidase accessory protein FixG
MQGRACDGSAGLSQINATGGAAGELGRAEAAVTKSCEQGEMSSEAMQVEDALSRAQQKSSPLYAGRVEVYAKAIKGRYRTIKWTALIVLLGIYYLVPWLRWDRGPTAPDQAVLVDMAGRRLYFFWIEIWPQEVYFLTGILILAAFGLFLATSLFGRLWCGFACPQTVWTDLFMQVERWIEGDRAERMRFDKAPWTAAKWRKRLTKHAAWLLISFLTGGAWIMYFGDAPTVVRDFFTGEAGAAAYFFVGLFTATTYLLAGFAREQVCTYMCPWPRIQGALVDKDTMAVTYEAWRGEPRGKYRKGESWDARGDCIDCKQCVAVCPTGIDIRDGFQLECIGCGLCIDACNDVMTKVGRPLHLIAYDSERNQELRAASQPSVYRLFRPRTILYVIIIAAVSATMLSILALRSTVDVNILPDRNPLFVTLSDGSIRNGYTIRLMNKERMAKAYELSVDGHDGRLSVVGQEGHAPVVTLQAPPDGVSTHRVFVQLPRAEVKGEVNDMTFELKDTTTGNAATFDTVFRGPKR